MDGIHDLGGRQGFGPVRVEPDEPAFHDRWEAVVRAIARRTFALGFTKNVDQFRHAIERIDPGAYLTHGYYGRWLGGLENLLVEAGVISTESLEQRLRELGGQTTDLVAARPDPALVIPEPSEVEGAARKLERQPLYPVGQLVRTRSFGVSGHTRLPAYARGRLGCIDSLQGGWVFPDSNAHGRGEDPQPLYSVRFAGAELWGDEAEPGQFVYLDLFESYLEASDG